MDGYLKPRAIARNDRAGDPYYVLAYRAGTKLTDPATGKVHKYPRPDVKAAGVVVPSEYQGDKRLNWARNLSSLAFAMKHGHLKNGDHLGPEFVGTFPKDSTTSQQRRITRMFVQAMSDEYGIAMTYSIHGPWKGRSTRPHSHMIGTSRKVGPKGIGPIAVTGLTPAQQEALEVENPTAFARRQWSESIRTVYRGAASERSGSGKSTSQKNLLPLEQYPRKIQQQAVAVARLTKRLTTSYRKSKEDDRAKGVFGWQKKEKLSIKLARAQRAADKLNELLAEASTVGGFAAVAEKRRYAPKASAQLRRMSRLSPQERAVRDRAIERNRKAGSQEQVMERAVNLWTKRTRSGQSVSIPQIMKQARTEVGARGGKSGAYGRE